MTKAKEKKFVNDSSPAWAYYTFAFIFVGIGYALGFMERDVLVMPSFASALVCVVLANIGRIKSFKAAGIEAVLNETKAAIRESRDLAMISSKMLLSLVQRAGRLGGYSDSEKQDIEKSVNKVLNQFDATPEERAEVYKNWHELICFDYAHGLLGGHTVPAKAEQDADLQAEWKSLRRRPLGNPASPEEIHEFLSKYGYLNEENIELLKDYSHYIENHKHRRPEVWADRERWTLRRLGEK
jgi:hypothetical protein